MASYRPYIALFDRLNLGIFSKQDIQEIKRVLGNDTSPLMGMDGMSGFVIAFVSTNTAQETLERLSLAIGKNTRVAVLELGHDQSQLGLDYHRMWLQMINWMTKEKNAGRQL